jgi:cytochrome c553
MSTKRRLPIAATLVLAVLIVSASAEEKQDAPPEFPREDVEFFENSVRPLFVTKCIDCHGPDKQEGKLRLDSREAVLAGGENGPAIVPGDPEHSLLIAAVHYKDDRAQMPPKGKLDDDKLAALTRWVKLNAPWPTRNATLKPILAIPEFKITPESRDFWSLKRVVEPPLPVVQRTDWPQSAVDAFVLSKLESQEFSPSPPADKRTLLRRVTFDLTGLPPTVAEVEPFLADESPEAFTHVVDRLLDSPQYGERMARLWLDVARYGEDQAHTFEARRYPQGFRYRDWVVAAFNRDLPYDDFIREQIAADLYDGPDQTERLAALGYFACGPVYYGDRKGMDQIADRIDALTRGFLGFTVACARCHDHKYDPISTVDYYSLAGVFASTEYVELPLVPQAEIDEIEKSLTEKEKGDKKRAKKYPFLHTLKEAKEPRNLQVHVRGNEETLGPEAPRRFVEVLCTPEPAPFTAGSGRKELAEAIASPSNPLTARVLVNRIWQQHFGKGLVRTPSNFGILGERPTHPELLDYLAAKFVASGWSIKALHREIVLSATYQQASQSTSNDPENRLLAHYPRRRLEAEMWRDAMLAASGRLDGTLGGPSSELAKDDNRRRTLYGFVSRHELDPFLRLFDFPDPNITSDMRPVTTVPLQQLFVLNSEFMIASARALADRVQDASADDEQRIRFAYELLYSRPPTDAEIAVGKEYLAADDESSGNEPAEAQPAKLSRWQRYAHALLAANEFLYVD